MIAVASGSLFLAFGYARARDSFHEISTELRNTPIGWGLLAGHLAAFLCFVLLSLRPFGTGYAIGAAWYAAGVLAIALAACAFVPPKSAWQMVRSTGYAWAYALAAGAAAWRLAVAFPLWNGAVWDPAINLYWRPATELTFRLVEAFLHLFLNQVVANRSTMTLGGANFTVTVLPWCAGFEGIVLMLVFGVSWLWFFRREFRFPQALVLIPAGMVVIWVANAVRITALILIGVAGARSVALGGFHSQAGWIAFNCVALGFAVASRRMPWVVRETPARVRRESQRYPTAAYLVPFLAILAAGMISRAASDGFEWLYPLRFAAAAAALWLFRLTYAKLDWRFGWFSLVAGGAVFAMWLGLDLAAGAHADKGIALGLASLPIPARLAWLVMRTAAAVVAVPMAEELAFRGFLIRRMISADFESLNARQYTYVAVVISSVAFGLMHGERWLAGTLAGLIYAVAFLRRGRIGDAVAAHATTNALLAAWVLTGGRWYLW